MTFDFCEWKPKAATRTEKIFSENISHFASFNLFISASFDSVSMDSAPAVENKSSSIEIPPEGLLNTELQPGQKGVIRSKSKHGLGDSFLMICVIVSDFVVYSPDYQARSRKTAKGSGQAQKVDENDGQKGETTSPGEERAS